MNLWKAYIKPNSKNFLIKLNTEQIEQVKKQPVHSPLLAQQEKGTRSACALPYELYADCELSADQKTVSVQLRAGDTVFGKQSAGSPFHIYAPGTFRQETMRTWDYAVAAGNELSDLWTIADFENSQYHLKVYGPNGFFREFKGSNQDPELIVNCSYEYNKQNSQKFTGNVSLGFVNHSKQAQTIEITDNVYKTPAISKTIPTVITGGKAVFVILNLSKSFGWYDFTVRVKGNASCEKRYAGRVETGQASKTDPFMGRVV
jgi:phospholipase C